MPLPPHPGLPGSQVIPDGWAAVHAPVVTKTLDCTVTIGPAGTTATFNPATRRTETTTAAAVYTGAASIGLASIGNSTEGQRIEAADDQVDARAYVVRLPAGNPDAAAIVVDHVVRVTDAPTAALIGRRLVVTGISRPGREFSRVLTARLYE